MKTIKFSKNDINLDIKFDEERKTVWMSQEEIAKLFSKSRSRVAHIIKEIQHNNPEFARVCAENAQTGSDGKTYKYIVYSLDAIHEIGYKINPSFTNEFVDWCKDELNKLNNQIIPIESNIIRFDNGNISIDVTVSPMEQTVWLTQNQIAVLFSTTQQNISLHIKNIIEENELTNDSVHKESLYTAIDGKDYKVSWYNLDMILAIGYRIKTKKAIEFRRWATSILKDYMLKGYAINDDRVIVTNENYITLTNKVLSLDERMNKLEQDDKYRFLDILLKNETLFDSLVLIDSLIRNAREVVTLIDPYVDIQTLNAFKNKLIDVKLFIITSKVCHLSQKDINLFLKEYGNLYVVYSPDYHDRYLIVDNTYYYHLGTSINYMGKRISQVTQITKKGIIDFLNRKCNEYIK